MAKSNCLFYAIPRWLRIAREGEESYLVIRLSRVRWGLIHFLVGKLDKNTNQIAVESFKPHKKEKSGVEILFEGKVVDGDLP